MSFKPINTQEELEAVLKDRLQRAEEKYSDYLSPEAVKDLKATYAGYASPQEIEDIKKSYSDYTSPEDLKKLEEDYTSQLANLKAENSNLKTSALKNQIISETNLPASFASRLQGATEEELRNDAKSLSELIQANAKTPTLPLGGQDTRTEKDDAKAGALRELASKITF